VIRPYCLITADELRQKQADVRKKRIEELKSKDMERQLAAEERRKKREQDEQVSVSTGYNGIRQSWKKHGAASSKTL